MLMRKTVLVRKLQFHQLLKNTWLMVLQSVSTVKLLVNQPQWSHGERIGDRHAKNHGAHRPLKMEGGPLSLKTQCPRIKGLIRARPWTGKRLKIHEKYPEIPEILKLYIFCYYYWTLWISRGNQLATPDAVLFVTAPKFNVTCPSGTFKAPDNSCVDCWCNGVSSQVK